MILTEKSVNYINEFLNKNHLGQNSKSVILRIQPAGAAGPAPAGAGTIIASGTILFVDPNAGNKTYIVTSKEVLQLYNIASTPPAAAAAPARPLFDLTAGTALDTLITNFQNNVEIVYSEELWKTPTFGSTALGVVVKFKFDDSSWDYDLIMLESTNAALHAYVGSDSGPAWDASRWKTLADIPSSGEVMADYAHADSVLLTGFGNTLAPHDFHFATPALVTPQRNQSITFTSSPTPPTPPTAPAPPIPAHSLQVMLTNPRSKDTSKNLFFWPVPALGAPLVMTDKFAAIRTSTEAAVLGAPPRETCLIADTGGGAYGYSKSERATKFIGVVSGINGTITGDEEWKRAWTEALKVNKKGLNSVWEIMKDFLPWPYKNQVITLISDMVGSWPLAWPPAPEGYFRSNQKTQMEKWVDNNCHNNADTTSIQNAVGKILAGAAHKGGWGSTGSYVNVKDNSIYHASSGIIGKRGSITIWFLPVGQNAYQIYAMGAHSDAAPAQTGCKKNDFAYSVSALVDTNANTVINTAGSDADSIYDGPPIKWGGTNIVVGGFYCIS